MEWIVNNWFLFIVLGLVAAMFIFGRRPGGHHEGDPHGQQEGTNDADSHHKGGGCCH
jgi:hypothetical protein